MVSILLGDVNQDGQLNVLDIVSTVAHILGNEQFNETQLYAADMNGDGFINVLDIVQMVNGILLLPRTNTTPVINAKIENAGNDCIDFSYGSYNLINATLNMCGDKALSIGENSKLTSNSINIQNSNIGIATKDSSVSNFSNVKMNNLYYKMFFL